MPYVSSPSSKSSRREAQLLYSTVAGHLEKLEKTTKRLELTEGLVELFRETPTKIIDKVVYLIQGKLYPDFVGVEIGIAEKLAIKAVSLAVGVHSEKVEQVYKQLGDIGLATEKLLQSGTQVVLLREPLSVERVYETLDRIARTTGAGSVESKLRNLCSLLNDASPVEAKHIVKTVTGQLRLGVADYTILDALAVAFTGQRENRRDLERAYNLSSDLGALARNVATKGLEGAKKIGVSVGRPIRPMLAERLETAEEALQKLGGKCAVEYKLDGERLQIHRSNKEIRLFSRRLENITGHYPDAIELVRSNVKGKELVAEAEIVAVNLESGEYLPFQELMHRRRKHGVQQAMQQFPIALNLFDLLYFEGRDYTLESYRTRRDLLESIVEENDRIRAVPALVASKAEEIEEFMEKAISEGCEGVVIKDLESPYRAGAREFAWIKLKREYRSELTDTLDLVVIGGFHGRGRRAGTLGTYLLAAYDSRAGTFQTTCKIGTGFTDDDLLKFPEYLRRSQIDHPDPRVDSKMKPDIWFVPSMVIEVIASEITLSPVHTCGLGMIRAGSGMGLRFPKFTGKIRTDKRAEDATTVQELASMYRGQLKKIEKIDSAAGP